MLDRTAFAHLGIACHRMVWRLLLVLPIWWNLYFTQYYLFNFGLAGRPRLNGRRVDLAIERLDKAPAARVGHVMVPKVVAPAVVVARKGHCGEGVGGEGGGIWVSDKYIKILLM